MNNDGCMCSRRIRTAPTSCPSLRHRSWMQDDGNLPRLGHAVSLSAMERAGIAFTHLNPEMPLQRRTATGRSASQVSPRAKSWGGALRLMPECLKQTMPHLLCMDWVQLRTVTGRSASQRWPSAKNWACAWSMVAGQSRSTQRLTDRCCGLQRRMGTGHSASRRSPRTRSWGGGWCEATRSWRQRCELAFRTI